MALNEDVSVHSSRALQIEREYFKTNIFNKNIGEKMIRS